MKKFSDLLKEITESTAFNDPPVMLVLRRKAIRTFPGGQSIAQYTNDNLKIDVAIPYTPGQLGKKHTNIATTSEETHPKFTKVRINKPDDEYHGEVGAVTGHFSKDPNKHFVEFSDVKGNKRVYKGHELTAESMMTIDEIRDLGKDSRDINAGLGHRYSHLRVKENPKAHKANSSYAAWTVHGKNDGDKKGKAIATLVHKVNTKFEETQIGIDEAMSPELKKIRKERAMFKRDLSRQEDNFDTAKQRLDWAKKALAGHIKKHGKTLNPLGEEIVNELSQKTLKSYIHKNLDVHGKDRKGRETQRAFGFYRAINKIKKEEVENDTIMEATIHSLHTIMKTQHPATVRFRDGSTAMIDHPTAHQVMHLHGKVNRQNKKKIESLINSGASGIKKISAFIAKHMKVGK